MEYTEGGSNKDYQENGRNRYYTDGPDNHYYTGGQPAQRVQSTDDATINIKEWVFRFLSYWYLFVISVVIALCLGYIKNRSWKPQYTTESKIIIAEAKSTTDYNFMQNFVGGMSYANANNQLLVLGSYGLVNRTVQKLPFFIDYFERGRFKTTNLYGHEPIFITDLQLTPEAYFFSYKVTPIDDNQFQIELDEGYPKSMNNIARTFKPIKARYGNKVTSKLFSGTIEKLAMTPDQKTFYFRFRDIRSLEEEFANRLSLGYMGTNKDPSTVVSVTLTSDVPLRDQDFLNALAKEFLASNLEEKNEEANRTITFINDQLILLSDSLNSAEAKLRQYRAMNNIVDISSYSSQVLTKMNALDAHRSELNLKEAYFDELAKYLTQTVMDEKLVAPSSIGVADPTLLDLVAQFNELQQKRSDIGEKNPQYPRITKRMNEIRETMLEVLKNVRKVHNMERASFEREYSQVTGQIQNLPDKEFEMINYERAYKINDNYYTFLLQKQSEAQIRKASNIPDNKILQEARTSNYPVNTNEKTQRYLIFLVIGLLIPTAYIILRVVLDSSINTEDDIRRLTDIPIIGSTLHTDSKALVASTKSKRSVYTEKYRIIRSRIEKTIGKKECSFISVTSAESGDGKSHFALNMAGIYSMISDKVLLMDMDLRNPTLSRNCGYGSAKGLVHVLIGEATLDEVIVTDNEELGYDFIPVGVVPINSAELIRSKKMEEVFEELRNRYEHIVVDTSPLGLVSDAIEIMRKTDVNMLITRSHKTNKSFFKNFASQVVVDGIENCFVVLNDLPLAKKRKGLLRYGKYSGSYGYGYGYGSYGSYGSYGAYGYGSHYYNSNGEKYYTSDEETGNKEKKD